LKVRFERRDAREEISQFLVGRDPSTHHYCFGEREERGKRPKKKKGGENGKMKFRKKMLEALQKASKTVKRAPTAALILLVILAMFSSIELVHAVPYRRYGYLQITDDTFTEKMYLTARHGSDTTLSAIFNETRPEGNYTSVIFLKIDASPLVHQYAYLTVKLELYLCTTPGWWPSVGIYLSPNSSWNEGTLDWAHQPNLTNDLISWEFINSYVGEYYWWDFDITYGMRKALLTGNTMITFVIACINDWTYYGGIQMKSREAEQNLRPRVIVEAAESFPAEIEGDANGDCIVNLKDAALIGANWQKTFPNINPPAADLNNDGIVNIKDSTIVSTHWGNTTGGPIAYSSDLRFEIPEDDGDYEVWYSIMMKMYISNSSQHTWFRATWVDDKIYNIKVDGNLKFTGPSGNPTIVDLGYISNGYHTLSFDFVEVQGKGGFRVCVAPDNNEAIATKLTRFRIFLPWWWGEYIVKTTTYFAGGDFFLDGFAADYIDDIWVDVDFKWDDWMYDCSPYFTVDGWGDGFLYPLDYQTKDWHTVKFRFVSDWWNGMLDFRYISGSIEKEKIRDPRFYASLNYTYTQTYWGIWLPYIWVDYVTPYKVMIEGGSRWRDPAHPAYSKRDFEAKAIFGVYVNRTFYESYPDLGISRYVNATFEIALGCKGAGWALPPASTNDIGITLNLTRLSFDTDIPDDDCWGWWYLTLNNVTLDLYSFPWLDITKLEYYGEPGESVVKNDWTIAADYAGTIIMFTAGVLQPEIGITNALIGQIVGLAVKGGVAAYRYTPGQQLVPLMKLYKSTIIDKYDITKYLALSAWDL
jgi:hypothetical protein